jgi:hypothetical protein
MLACTVIVANLCFGNPAFVAMHDMGLSAYAVVEMADTETRVDIRDDQVLFLDLGKLPGACAGGFCIGYHRRCEKNGDEIKCTYRYAVPGDNLEKTFELKARGERDLAVAAHSISIISSSGRAVGGIPLDKLEVEAVSDVPPYCRAGGPLADRRPNAARDRPK